jgi:hypothetical protein
MCDKVQSNISLLFKIAKTAIFSINFEDIIAAKPYYFTVS